MPWVGAVRRSQLNVGLMLTAESACSPPSQTTTVSRIIQITKYCMKANTKYYILYEANICSLECKLWKVSEVVPKIFSLLLKGGNLSEDFIVGK